MPEADTETMSGTPFHAGELAMQDRVGKRESVAAFANRAIRSHMPDQHRTFFEQLRFMIVGSVDDRGRPWSSIVSGDPGFVESPDSTSLVLRTRVPNDDPLHHSLRVGRPLGMVGIELETRRRNRVNGRVSELLDDGFALTVDQSFGNCPQYIQQRCLAPSPSSQASDSRASAFSTLDEAARDMIRQADTLFVASHATRTDTRSPNSDPQRHGVDVSHRGGLPGFVRIEGDTLTIADYAGNNLFNTLGNFLLEPRAGLLFIDFDRGELLQMTGSVDILDATDAQVSSFPGAERAWQFHLEAGLRWRDALPFRMQFEAYAVESLQTGQAGLHDAVPETTAVSPSQTATHNTHSTHSTHTDKNTDLFTDAAANADAPWWNARIVRIVRESTNIASFYLQTADDAPLPTYLPGQFIPVRLPVDNANGPGSWLTRTYSLSSAPDDGLLRISVKREAFGTVSQRLHDTFSVGDTLSLGTPAGSFYLDPAEQRPAVLLAAGVGITPKIAMARQVAHHGRKEHHFRPLFVLHVCRHEEERAFATEFLDLANAAGPRLQYHRFTTAAPNVGTDPLSAVQQGRIDADVLRRLLPLDDHDFMLCGPGEFMQSMYDALSLLGVRDERIHAEAFGPARLNREPTTVTTATASAVEDANETQETFTVQFEGTPVSTSWQTGGLSLLELAESEGLTPPFACRSGSCGSCAARLVEGHVSYQREVTAGVAPDEVLTCCAIPAGPGDRLVVAW